MQRTRTETDACRSSAATTTVEDTTPLPTMDSLQDIVDLAESRSDVFVRYSENPWRDVTATSYDSEAEVALKQAKERYESRFRVGQDSADP